MMLNKSVIKPARSGPSCSKLMVLLVNASLKRSLLNMAYMLIFLLKKCVAFANAKATHIFSAKIFVN